ncbi:hypothetical protein BHE74_00036828 [Ensete ventricosum]|nr:hypothetical protein BHE74_00036828 [Ensete ventricosum]
MRCRLQGDGGLFAAKCLADPAHRIVRPQHADYHSCLSFTTAHHKPTSTRQVLVTAVEVVRRFFSSRPSDEDPTAVSLSELEDWRPRTVTGVSGLDATPIPDESSQPSVAVTDQRHGVSPGGEIDETDGGDHVVGLRGEERRDGAPAVLLVFGTRQRVLEIELHCSSSSSIVCLTDRRGEREGKGRVFRMRKGERKPLQQERNVKVISKPFFDVKEKQRNVVMGDCNRVGIGREGEGRGNERCREKGTGVAVVWGLKGWGCCLGPQAQRQRQRQQQQKQRGFGGLTSALAEC